MTLIYTRILVVLFIVLTPYADCYLRRYPGSFIGNGLSNGQYTWALKRYMFNIQKFRRYQPLGHRGLYAGSTGLSYRHHYNPLFSYTGHTRSYEFPFDPFTFSLY